MDVCVENVFTAPTIEAINVIQATAEENDRAASSDPHHGHRETDAEQKAVARGFSPADSSDTPKTEPAVEKNPWSAWAWLGLGRTRADTKRGAKSRSFAVRIRNIVH